MPDSETLITLANVGRFHGWPYYCLVEKTTDDLAVLLEVKLHYCGDIVRRISGAPNDIPLLLMYAINDHQLETQNIPPQPAAPSVFKL